MSTVVGGLSCKRIICPDTFGTSSRNISQPNHKLTMFQVFKIVWVEPLGNSNDRVTVATTYMGESAASKCRLFVVIREGPDCCSCL